MNFKKLAAIGLALTMTSAAMSSCAEGDLPASVSAAQTQSMVTERKVSMSVAYPEEYFISYEAVSKTGVIYTVSKGVDAVGNIYMKDMGEEVLYILEGSGYIRYVFDKNGIPVRDGQNKYTGKSVEKMTDHFELFSKHLRTPFMTTADHVADTTLLGRDVAEYEVGITFINFTQKYSFTQDLETGICLSWNSSTAVGNHITSAEEGNFTCVAFETENVMLPGIEKISAQ